MLANNVYILFPFLPLYIFALYIDQQFDHGCWYPGDGISDTPYEDSPYYICPNGTESTRNSCNFFFHPGDDPYQNYMDYTADSCRDHFSPGQIRRMTAMWGTYRS